MNILDMIKQLAQIDEFDATKFLISIILPTTSLAGLANLLRSDKKLTYRSVASVVLNSGLFGCAVAAAMLTKYGEEGALLIVAVSILSGLGGNALVDFCLEVIRSIIRKQSGIDEK